jgi:hypothetical protein
MGHDNIQPSVVNAIKAAEEVGGPKEISTLTKALDGLSQMQLEAVGHALPDINRKEAATHLDLPQLFLAVSGGSNGDGTVTSAGYTLEKLSATGEPSVIYRREFKTDHGIKSDFKFDPSTHQLAAIDATSPNGPPTHIKINPTDRN